MSRRHDIWRPPTSSCGFSTLNWKRLTSNFLRTFSEMPQFWITSIQVRHLGGPELTTWQDGTPSGALFITSFAGNHIVISFHGFYGLYGGTWFVRVCPWSGFIHSSVMVRKLLNWYSTHLITPEYSTTHTRMLLNLHVTFKLHTQDASVLQSFSGQSSLQRRYNGRNGVSNHELHDCLLNRLFRSKSKKTWKCGEFTGDRWIPRTKGQ